MATRRGKSYQSFTSLRLSAVDNIDLRKLNCMWYCDAVVGANAIWLYMQAAPEEMNVGLDLFAALLVSG